MQLRTRDYESEVKLGGEEIKNVTTFKYLRSMFDTEGGTTTDCKNRVRLAWYKWREVTGVICDEKVIIIIIILARMAVI